MVNSFYTHTYVTCWLAGSQLSQETGFRIGVGDIDGTIGTLGGGVQNISWSSTGGRFTGESGFHSGPMGGVGGCPSAVEMMASSAFLIATYFSDAGDAAVTTGSEAASRVSPAAVHGGPAMNHRLQNMNYIYTYTIAIYYVRIYAI